jgi:drug/metabolite transporter (DMT)-like permease
VSTTVAALLGGGGAALAWAATSIATAHASRVASPVTVLAWVMLVGLVVNVPLAAARGGVSSTPAEAWVALGIAGAANVLGLAIAYRAYRAGPVGLVAPILATEGALAAMIAVVFGEKLALAAFPVLGMIVFGVVVVTAASPAPTGETALIGPRKVVALATIAALLFGVGLYAAGVAARDVPGIWVALAPRAIGATFLAIPLLMLGKARPPRAIAPYVVAAGLMEIVGFLSYSAGSRHSVAIAAVTAAQFATLTVIFGSLFFRERLGRVQLVGIGVVIVGVTALAAVA